MKPLNYLFIYLLLFLLLPACHQVTLVVEEIPDNTPPGAALFVSGNFNYWDPGDQRYTLKLNKDSTYSVQLPHGSGTIFYKFTRGDWHRVENDVCGNPLCDRSFRYGSGDTVFARIASWGDLDPTRCDQVTFIVDKIPNNTPNSQSIYLTGNFNNWKTCDEQYRLKRNQQGNYFIKLPRQVSILAFKLTRGTWESEEVDAYGNVIQNRTFVYGKQDSVHLEISGWKDFRSTNPALVTLIVDVPRSTPSGDKIYLASNFNGWFPRDSQLVLRQLPNGLYTLNLPRKQDYIEFKFTRGDWFTVEADQLGRDVDNRSFTYGRKDTLFLRVKSWRDIALRKTFK